MTSITVANPDRDLQAYYENCFVEIYGPQPPSWWNPNDPAQLPPKLLRRIEGILA